MKISTISNNKTSFGYNIEFHEKMHDKLSRKKRDSAIAQQLIELDYWAMELEDDIVSLEKQNKTGTQNYSHLVDLLVETRETFANYIDRIFPEIKYCQNASEQYIEESKEEKNETASFWRTYLSGRIEENCREFKETISNLTSALKVKNKEEVQQTSDYNQKETNEKDKNPNKTIGELLKDAFDKETSDLITLYEPNQYSPKGFCDVVGMNELKEKLQDEVIAYIKNPELEKSDFEEYGIRAPRGYLLYGPPGCGKTYIACALAAEANIPVYKMDVSKIGSKYVNETSNNLQNAFDNLAEVIETTGGRAILFMDEVDALAKSRNYGSSSCGEDEKTVSTLLKNIETARDKGIIVFAATNRFDALDEAFKARFDGQYYIGLPDIKTIEKLIQKELIKRNKGQALASDEEKISELAKKLKGYSNRAIVMIVDEAAKIAKKDNRSDITYNHIEKAIKESELEKPDERKYIANSKKNKAPMGFSAVV